MPHPIIAAADSLAEVLKDVSTVNPTFMTVEEKASALRELVRVESQLVELRLRVMAAAEDVVAQTGSRDIASWMAAQTRTRYEDARRDAWLADGIDRVYSELAAGLREGAVNPAQGAIVARALDALPADADADTRSLAERTLVGFCADFGPRELTRLGRRVLEVIAPEMADAAEARRLAALEADASHQAKLSLRRNGDGTTRLSGQIPDLAATRLAHYLEAFTNPRKPPVVASDAQVSAAEQGDPFLRLPYPRRLGDAFVAFLEAVDTHRLPIHAGDATTLLVTVSLDSLRAELASAQVLTGGHIPGDAEAADAISGGEARRLACMSGIIPVVLGGPSEPLDLGRTRRLFSTAQRKALLLRDGTCRAEGCSIPGTWTEAHHPDPWSRGGTTDLANALLLCRHHHRRAHDPAYSSRRGPDGRLSFHRRC
ncbi:MAG: DUF222 domain-containing protein [Nocardioides sp.]